MALRWLERTSVSVDQTTPGILHMDIDGKGPFEPAIEFIVSLDYFLPSGLFNLDAQCGVII